MCNLRILLLVDFQFQYQPSEIIKKIIKIMHILRAKLHQMKQIINQTQALQTQSSLHTIIVCEVRSKYFKSWTKREIYVSLDEKLLYMICSVSNKKKSYSLDQVSYTRNPIQQTIKLKVSPSRNYEMKVNSDLEELLKDIEYYHNFKLFSTVQLQLKTEPPKKICYQNVGKKPSFIEPPTLAKKKSSEEKKQIKKEKTHIKPLIQYERQTSYIKESDWKRDRKNGGLIFINEQRKHIIPQMISYTAKKIVSSGSFTSINFPTFAMKPESALENYCKCLGAAPLLLENTNPNPIQRMKAFNTIILSLSIQLNDIEKPFNALLGQTFQGEIGGYSVYAEQISTKPNVSCFLLIGRNYKLYGNLQLKANIGLNEAVGVFHGQITLEFNDGAKIIGIMPKGVMSGVIFGDTKFGPTGAVYSYDPNNNLVCSYETVDTDSMTGQIGILKHSAHQRFLKKMKGKNVEQFPYFSQKDYQTILSRLQVVYTDSISYDGKLYFKYSDKKNLPIKLTQLIAKNEKKLPSDSSFRQDIKLRKENNIKDSQKVNDELQTEQQRLRKLRKHKTHKNH